MKISRRTFPPQREAIYRPITSNDIRGVWFLGGDVHHASITRVALDGPKGTFARCVHGSGR